MKILRGLNGHFCLLRPGDSLISVGVIQKLPLFFFFFFFFVVRFWEGVGVLFGVLNATSVSFLFLQRKDIYGL